MKTMCEQSYKTLTDAIVVQAGIDYLKSLRILDIYRDNPERKINAQARIAEVRHFFKSKWYEELSDVDGRNMLIRLNRSYRKIRESGNLNRIKNLGRS